MRIVAVVSAKGGVGKTTLTANLSAALSAAGRRVVVVDLDPQNALRLHFGVSPDLIDGVARATLAAQRWSGHLQSTSQGIGVLPFGALNESDRRTFEQQLDTQHSWLRENLLGLGLGEDDVVVIDTPPGPSVYLKQALSTAHFALAVLLADAASYATIPLMEQLLGTYCAERDDFLGAAYVFNQVDQSRQLARDVVKVLRSTLGQRLFPGVIHLDQAVGEALASDQTTLQYDPYSQATEDFQQCAQWLLEAISVAPGQAT